MARLRGAATTPMAEAILGTVRIVAAVRPGRLVITYTRESRRAGATGCGGARVHLLGRGPQGDRRRPLPPPAPARPAQDGSAVAEESWLAPSADRRSRRRLLPHGP